MELPGLAVALDMSPDDVGSIAFPFSHIAGPDYFGTMLLAGFPAILFEASETSAIRMALERILRSSVSSE